MGAPFARNHRCAVTGCTHFITVTLLMCHGHWRKVPRRLQGQIYKSWNGGKPFPGYTQLVLHARDAAGDPYARQLLRRHGLDSARD